LSEAAGDQLRQVTLQLACIDRTPQQFRQDLEEQKHYPVSLIYLLSVSFQPYFYAS